MFILEFYIIGALAIVFLCWQAPAMAASLMSAVGSSSSASSAQNTASGMRGSVISAGSMGERAGQVLDSVNQKMGGMLGKATTPPTTGRTP